MPLLFYAPIFRAVAFLRDCNIDTIFPRTRGFRRLERFASRFQNRFLAGEVLPSNDTHVGAIASYGTEFRSRIAFFKS